MRFGRLFHHRSICIDSRIIALKWELSCSRRTNCETKKTTKDHRLEAGSSDAAGLCHVAKHLQSRLDHFGNAVGYPGHRPG